MLMNLKPYAYTRGQDPVLDASFDASRSYGKLRLGRQEIFWRSGLRWCVVPLARVRRVYRQVEPVYGKLCCGGASFDIHRLILVTEDQTLSLHIGDNQIGGQVQKEAQALLQTLEQEHPELEYGKA